MNVKSASVISVNKEVLNGTPVFHGTRVPVKNLFDFLEAGRTIDFFLEQFPSVERKQVAEVLHIAGTIVSEFNSYENPDRRVFA